MKFLFILGVLLLLTLALALGTMAGTKPPPDDEHLDDWDRE